jgi:hypothetical protein
MTNLLKKLIPNGKDHTLEVPTYEGDVSNEQIVGGIKNSITVAAPLSLMTKQKALIHAAWIVALADQSENFQDFRQILKAVLET